MRFAAVLLLATTLTACQSVQNTAGSPTVYQNPGSPGAVRGVGVESQDLISMTDQMLRDMLAEPRLGNAAIPPNVIIDGEYFINESSSRLNKNTITDRLRVSLQRSAQGRMNFVGRHYAQMVETERRLKRQGVVDAGKNPKAAAPKGGDYRLGGRITSIDSRDTWTGMVSRFTQITFEMVDLETGEIIWSNLYDLSKAAADDVVYR